jgi:DNA (cytosine-5)-methyltransferase 1
LNINKKSNLGDVSQVEVEDIPDFDLMTFGFPCQDISIAGRQQGLSKGSGTRSSLLWEAMRIAKYKKPKYMIAENVKNLIGKRFKDSFNKWLDELNEMGYNTYFEVLNAKYFGVPQNRERVFVISIRKDVDDGIFEFPIGKDTGIRLKDILEETVDEKYYLSEKVQNRFKFRDTYHENIIGTTAPKFRTIGQRDLVYKKEGIMGALVATDYKQPKQILEETHNLRQIGLLGDKNSQGNRVYDPNYISTTLVGNAGGLGGKTGLYLMEEYDVQAGAIRGRYDENKKVKQQLELNKNGTTNALTTVQKDNVIVEKQPFKIRKLTPKECFRLMGFTDEDFQKAKDTGNSDTQLYKQAGNSIVVLVLEAIFKNLFKNKIN